MICYLNCSIGDGSIDDINQNRFLELQNKHIYSTNLSLWSLLGRFRSFHISNKTFPAVLSQILPCLICSIMKLDSIFSFYFFWTWNCTFIWFLSEELLFVIEFRCHHWTSALYYTLFDLVLHRYYRCKITYALLCGLGKPDSILDLIP